MAKDPICGMFVAEEPDALKLEARGRTHYFCSETCLKQFAQPEIELAGIRRMSYFSVVLSIPIVILSYYRPPAVGVDNIYLLFVLATSVQFVAGWRFYRGTYDAVKMRASNMDTLIAVGTSAAWAYSVLVTFLPGTFRGQGTYYDVSAVVIALILVGRLLEHSVKARANDAIGKLMDLQPKLALVIRSSGGEERVPVELLRPGDVVIVRPGEGLPVDGTVVEGRSSVDEKLVTGESMPVDKAVGATVVAGTINKSGTLKVKANRVGSDTTLSKIVELVEDAVSAKAPIERLANTVATYFVPIVVLVALSAFGGWYLVAGTSFSFAFTAAIAVLIIACPCALGVATPAAIVVGAGKGAENGILIKGGEYLEKAQKIDTVLFDKTGTLTKGEPSVTDVVSVVGESPDTILRMAATAEKRSEHPLAEAILERARAADPAIRDPSSFEAIAGGGVRAELDGREILLGSLGLMKNELVPTDGIQRQVSDLQHQGKTVMVLAIDSKVSGLIAVADTAKDSSRKAVEGLKKMGIEVGMLTGDNETTARAIASSLGIDRVLAEVTPDRKAEAIKTLQAEGRIVAMVGDGINDAPALAQADVGIAIGSGTDVAKETGGIILMRDDPKDVVAGIELSRRTMSKIKQNLFWAFAYNVALIPVAAGAFYFVTGTLLNPIFAAAAMALSSVTVIGNSLTLKRFHPTV